MSFPSEWFENWFDSPYYHVLYHHRNHDEACELIDNLLSMISPAPEVKFLDKACGRGRHAGYLAKKGYDTTGIDLSENSIRFAKRYYGKTAHFHVHDMREVLEKNTYDFILNLFTSFGYFETEPENQQVLDVVHAELKPDGYFVLDFLNPVWVAEHLKESENKVIQKIAFIIQRSIVDDCILKNIEVIDGDTRLRFEEKVKAYPFLKLKKMFQKSGLTVEHVFGDYHLNPFDEAISPRIILIARKS